MNPDIRKGRRFLHKRSLDVDAWPERRPQLCQITALRHGYVYYGHVRSGEGPTKAAWNCPEAYFLGEALGSWQD